MAVMREIYRPLHLNQGPLLFVGRRTSELIKYAANAFLAVKITFINEMADLCEAVGADVQDGRAASARQPHRLEVPARRARLRRLLLPQGHAGAGQDGAGREKSRAHRRDGRRREREAQGGDGGAHRPGRWAATSPASASRCWGSPSSPTPTTCATRPLSPSCRRSWRRAPRSAPSIPRAWSRRARSCRASALPIRPTPACTAPTRWSSPPNGTSSARWTCAASGRACARAVLVDLRNVYRPADMKALGFAYTGIGRGAD